MKPFNIKCTMQQVLLALLVLTSAQFSSATEIVTYYVNDALGSPIMALNQAGDVVWQENYQPYGQRQIKSAAASSDEQFYTGKQEEPDIGLQYYGARWYDPDTGRFISTDPVGVIEGNTHSFNRYAYANNNPYRFLDPTGMCSESTAKDGCLITGKSSGTAKNTPIDPTSPIVVNGHAMTGGGSDRSADFSKVSLADLGRSIQKIAKMDGSTLSNAIIKAGSTGNTVDIKVTSLKAGGGFDGDTPLSQKGAMGRFSVSLAGSVTADGKGNWSFSGAVSGEPDFQDYPYDSARTGTASALTSFGAGVQSVFGGKNYLIDFHGNQTIHVQGQ